MYFESQTLGKLIFSHLLTFRGGRLDNIRTSNFPYRFLLQGSGMGDVVRCERCSAGSLVWCLWLSFGAETFCLGFQTVCLNSANTTECSGQSLLQNSFGNAVQFGPRPYLSPAHRPRSLMTLTAPRKSAVSESLPPHKASRRLLTDSGKFFRGRKQHFMMSKISV